MFLLGLTAGQVTAFIVVAAYTGDPSWLAAAVGSLIGAALVGLSRRWWHRRQDRRQAVDPLAFPWRATDDDPFTDVVDLIDSRTPTAQDFDSLDLLLRFPASTGHRLAAARARHRDLCQPEPAERLAWADLKRRLESDADGGVSS